MMDHTFAAEVYEDAAERIQANGLAKKAFVQHSGDKATYCAAGQVRQVVFEKMGQQTRTHLTLGKLWEEMANKIDPNRDFRSFGVSTIGRWNDETYRTKEEVADFLISMAKDHRNA